MHLGPFYALKLKERQIGWNLLLKAEQAYPDIAVVGKMELSKPQKVTQQKQLSAENYVTIAEHRDFRRASEIKNWRVSTGYVLAEKGGPTPKGVDKKAAEEYMSRIKLQLPIDLSRVDWKKID